MFRNFPAQFLVNYFSIITCKNHSLPKTFLKSAILAPISLLLVYLAVAVGYARVHTLVLKRKKH